MRLHSARRPFLGLLAAAFPLAGGATAADLGNSSSYNAPPGMSSSSGNQASNFSIRDENGNLTVINGQFSSAVSSQSSGVQQATASASGVGSQSSGASGTFGGASAIGNQLNVVTVGSNNTVVVTSTQTNSGNQNASVVLNSNGQR